MQEEEAATEAYQGCTHSSAIQIATCTFHSFCITHTLLLAANQLTKGGAPFPTRPIAEAICALQHSTSR